MVQYIYGAPFQASGAALMLQGLVDAAQGVHITAGHELQQLGEGRGAATLEQLWRAYQNHCSQAPKDEPQDSVNARWNVTFQAAFRPFFDTHSFVQGWCTCMHHPLPLALLTNHTLCLPKQTTSMLGVAHAAGQGRVNSVWIMQREGRGAVVRIRKMTQHRPVMTQLTL